MSNRLRLLINMKIVINCMKIIFELLIVCNTYLNGFDFLLLILVIFIDLLLIIGIIYQRKI